MGDLGIGWFGRGFVRWELGVGWVGVGWRVDEGEMGGLGGVVDFGRRVLERSFGEEGSVLMRERWEVVEGGEGSRGIGIGLGRGEEGGVTGSG